MPDTSGVTMTRLRNGDLLAVDFHAYMKEGTGERQAVVETAVSSDNGKTWTHRSGVMTTPEAMRPIGEARRRLPRPVRCRASTARCPTRRRARPRGCHRRRHPQRDHPHLGQPHREIPARDLHRLRSGEGGDDAYVVRADGSRCWRSAIEQSTPGARRLRYWELPGGAVELSRVVHHDDTRP